MRLLAVECCELEGLGLYGDALRRLGVVVHRFRAHESPPAPRPADFDAVIVGGTPVRASEMQSHPCLGRVWTLLDAALDAELPCLGVCCGAQLMALRLGGRVHRSPVVEIGMADLRLAAGACDDRLTRGFPSRFQAFQWHGDAFGLPPGGRLLVRGRDCPAQMFRQGRWAGLLFHLEVTPDAARRWCDAYPDEMGRAGKTADSIVAECEAASSGMAALADRLMRNFVALAREPPA